jgi:hypothetical protein
MKLAEIILDLLETNYPGYQNKDFQQTEQLLKDQGWDHKGDYHFSHPKYPRHLINIMWPMGDITHHTEKGSEIVLQSDIAGHLRTLDGKKTEEGDDE